MPRPRKHAIPATAAANKRRVSLTLDLEAYVSLASAENETGLSKADLVDRMIVGYISSVVAKHKKLTEDAQKMDRREPPEKRA